MAGANSRVPLSDEKQEHGICLPEVLCVIVILASIYSAGALATRQALKPYARSVQMSSLIRVLKFHRESALLERRNIRLQFLPETQEIKNLSTPEESIFHFSPRLPLNNARFGLLSGETNILMFRADSSCTAGRITLGSNPACSIVLSRYGRLRGTCA